MLRTIYFAKATLPASNTYFGVQRPLSLVDFVFSTTVSNEKEKEGNFKN